MTGWDLDMNDADDKQLMVTMERVTHAIVQRFRRNNLLTMASTLDTSMSGMIGYTADEVCMRFMADVLATGKAHETVSYPKTWRDARRLERLQFYDNDYTFWRPRWFRRLMLWWYRRHPVQYTHVRVQKFARMCPHVDITTPNAHLLFLGGKP